MARIAAYSRILARSHPASTLVESCNAVGKASRLNALALGQPTIQNID